MSQELYFGEREAQRIDRIGDALERLAIATEKCNQATIPSLLAIQKASENTSLKDISFESARKIVSKHLKEDEHLRRSYVANIAMCLSDAQTRSVSAGLGNLDFDSSITRNEMAKVILERIFD